ncbi:uncharacterized protein LOC141687346 [Apium graveolens]|uniref:uncharacterized protein LOC141687346 n=1 Tax=Apium graveolens TaxID=4045 RepID=UPI003D7AF61A
MGEPAKALNEQGMLDTKDVLSSILRPTVTATHFEIKPQFIQFISNDSFAGLSTENPVDHLENFLEKCDTIKLTTKFYNGLTQEFRIFVDAASGGSIMKKNTEDAKALLDDMASNDNYPYSDRNHPKKGGKYDVDTLTMLNTTMRAMVKKIEQLDSRTSSIVASCDICGIVGHTQNICQFNPSGLAMEQANVLYNQN